MISPQPVRRAVQVAVVCASTAAICASVARAQQLIGYVRADDADVTGVTDVMDGQAVLSGSVGVTAKDHTAVITLGRGGLARVCQTSALHLTENRTTGTKASGTATAGAATGAATTAPLLFSLDRGAVEIRMNGLANDAIMTPDLRMTVRANGPLDVRLRVARNGDTCVENRGNAAPVLAVSDPFGESQYELMPGQHVLFEHGSLQEMVDHETEPCGCPDERGASVAEALLAPGGEKLGPKTATPAAAVELHPFPTAISEGLAPAVEAPKAEADPTQPQATEALRYNAADDANATVENGNRVGAANTGVGARSRQTAPVAPMPTVPASATPVSLGAAQPVDKEPKKAKPVDADRSPNRDVVHAIGHFFRKMFGG